MIKPSIGRVVWYYPPGHQPGEQPLAAVVARVWSDTCVNLAIFAASGCPMAAPPTSVLLVQPGADVPSGGGYCTWMPFQVGQAKLLTAAEPIRQEVALGDGTILRLIAEYGPKVVKWLIAIGILKVPPGFLTAAEEVLAATPA